MQSAVLVLAAFLAQENRQTVAVPMRDGVKLATDVYLPGADGPFPVLLVRTPYDKSARNLVDEAAAGRKRGYAMVFQDTRGRFASEGKKLPFIGETIGAHSDGRDTLEWILRQPWCNGKVGMFGGSATGITQLFLSDWSARPECLHVSVAPASLYHDMVYPGGIFRKHLLESWLNLTRSPTEAKQIWLDHPAYDDYWRAHDLATHYAKMTAPALHIGGYFDLFAQGTIDAFRGLQDQGGPGARGKQKLVLGPWTHVPLIEHSGVLKFPEAHRPPHELRDKWRWLDHHLKERSAEIDRIPAVVYYAMGAVGEASAPGNAWRTAETWPPPKSESAPFYFHRGGKLAFAAPGEAEPETVAHDPGDPCPTVGGPQFFEGITVGTQDQRVLEKRKDVLSFTSDVLAQPVDVTGRPRVNLWISSDASDADFFVKLCDVYPDGRCFNVAEGQLRARFRDGFSEPKPLAPGEVTPIVFDLTPTSIVFNRGHRVRVLVSCAGFPGFEPQPKPARNRVYVDGQRPSHVELPVLK